MMLDASDLQQLVAASRDPTSSQSALLRLPAVASTALQLLQNIQQDDGDGEEAQSGRQQALLLCYRVMRNAAATGSAATASLLHLGLLDLMRATLDIIGTAAISLNWQLPTAVSQTLANLCNTCADSAAAAWAAVFPLHLSIMAHVNAGPTQAATCLSLLACCKAVPGAAISLTGPQGAQMMMALLCTHKRMLQQGEHNDNLGLLVVHLCFSQDLLPNIFQAVGPERTGNRGGGTLQPTMAQAALLEVLCAEAHDMPEGAADQAVPGASPAATASMRFLVQLAEQLASVSAQQAPLSQGQQQVLQVALHLMRDICARDDSGHGMSGCGDVVAALQAAGFLPALLAMLKALKPIQRPQHQQEAAAAAAPAQGSGASGGIQVAELAPGLAQEAQHFPAAPPYPGFRTDLLAVLANAAHGRPVVQSEVCVLGGVELVLAQCQVDKQSPLAREWALWGVRNLCDGNAQAQEAIHQLQLCAAADNEELQRLGIQLGLDARTGKLRVTKRDGDAAMGRGA